MKKLLIVAVFVFAFAITMNVAFAGDCSCRFTGCLCPSTSVVNVNGALTTNNISATSGTGINAIKGVFGTAGITTGAASALGVTETYANNNNIDVVTNGLGKLSIFNANGAMTTNKVSAVAETGMNNIGCAGSSGITTGAAGATASALTVVNTNVVKVNRCCDLGCGPVCGK